MFWIRFASGRMRDNIFKTGIYWIRFASGRTWDNMLKTFMFLNRICKVARVSKGRNSASVAAHTSGQHFQKGIFRIRFARWRWLGVKPFWGKFCKGSTIRRPWRRAPLGKIFKKGIFGIRFEGCRGGSRGGTQCCCPGRNQSTVD